MKQDLEIGLTQHILLYRKEQATEIRIYLPKRVYLFTTVGRGGNNLLGRGALSAKEGGRWGFRLCNIHCIWIADISPCDALSLASA